MRTIGSTSRKEMRQSSLGVKLLHNENDSTNAGRGGLVAATDTSAALSRVAGTNLLEVVLAAPSRSAKEILESHDHVFVIGRSKPSSIV